MEFEKKGANAVSLQLFDANEHFRPENSQSSESCVNLVCLSIVKTNPCLIRYYGYTHPLNKRKVLKQCPTPLDFATITILDTLCRDNYCLNVDVKYCLTGSI